MAAESKPKAKPEQVSPADRRLANLKAKEKNLKAKLDRIAAFPKAQQEASRTRTEAHLSQVQAAIKKASKS